MAKKTTKKTAKKKTSKKSSPKTTAIVAKDTAENPEPEIKLNSRQELFCLNYVMGCSAAEAARRAGYSIHSAKMQGSKILRFPNIQARIRELQKEQKDEFMEGWKAMLREDVLRRQHEMASVDLRDFIKDDGSIDYVKLKEAEGVHLKKFQFRRTRTANKFGEREDITGTIEVSDPRQANEHLSKIAGLVEDDAKEAGPTNIMIIIGKDEAKY